MMMMDLKNEERMRWALYAPGRGFFSKLGAGSGLLPDEVRMTCHTVQDPSLAITWDTCEEMIRDVDAARAMMQWPEGKNDPFEKFVDVKVPKFAREEEQ